MFLVILLSLEMLLTIRIIAFCYYFIQTDRVCEIILCPGFRTKAYVCVRAHIYISVFMKVSSWLTFGAWHTRVFWMLVLYISVTSSLVFITLYRASTLFLLAFTYTLTLSCPDGSDTCHLFIFEDLPMQGDKGAPYLILMSLRTAKAPQAAAASCGVARVCSGGKRLYFCRRLFFMYVRSFKPGCLFMFVVAVCSGGGIFLAFCCAWKTYKLQLAKGESTSVFPE